MDPNKGTEENPLTPDSVEGQQEQTAPSEVDNGIDKDLLNQIGGLRQQSTDMLSGIASVLPKTPSPAIAEVIIAKRAVEDARMRLGVAMALLQGQDPWNSPAPQQNQ